MCLQVRRRVQVPDCSLTLEYWHEGVVSSVFDDKVSVIHFMMPETNEKEVGRLMETSLDLFIRDGDRLQVICQWNPTVPYEAILQNARKYIGCTRDQLPFKNTESFAWWCMFHSPQQKLGNSLGNSPEKLSEKFSEKLPETLSEKLPETLSEKLPEKLSEKLPEKLPETLIDKLFTFDGFLMVIVVGFFVVCSFIAWKQEQIPCTSTSSGSRKKKR